MAVKVLGSIVALMTATGVFVGASWDAWRVLLRAMFALPLAGPELEVYRQLTGRQRVPAGPSREVWLLIGRRGGKSIIAALIAVYQVTCRKYTLAPGEVGTFMVIAADRAQARVVRNYIGALLRSIGALEALVDDDLVERIDLKNGLRVEVHTASFRTLRGYTVIGAICDEVAFWQSDDSANPDTEILNALRPAMATQPDAILVCITSPYGRRGEVWKNYQRHFGKDESPVLVVQADTRTMNPLVPEAIIAAAYEDDPSSAAAEYGALFRVDVESFVSLEVVEACRMPGRFEQEPCGHHAYVGFTDPSGGSSDSFTLCVAHLERGDVVVDAIRERPAPFDPDAVVGEFADLLRSYRVTTVRGDRYAGEWPRERFRAHGIEYRVSDHTKSELYQAMLPRLNAGTIQLLDHARCVKQLCALERKTARGGRESIDHPPHGKDDVINAVAGASHTAKKATAAVAYARIARLNP